MNARAYYADLFDLERKPSREASSDRQLGSGKTPTSR